MSNVRKIKLVYIILTLLLFVPEFQINKTRHCHHQICTRKSTTEIIFLLPRIYKRFIKAD